ncbi:hypothetical protein [Shewanella surugensis]|uniref:YceI family protein n=1 Tax=Shewanella surugensis TaxID=212020 RepID=A0ABT0LC64_9GAMM|nr:hypothetical protein [Shewanella surugensis]MCL1125100.1 hypothetical protein [Shewanella surugensis]
MSFKKNLFTPIFVFFITSLFSYSVMAKNIEASKPQIQQKITPATAKQWLFVLSADKGKIRYQKSNTSYELSLTDIDKGVIAITDESFSETKMIPSNHFLKEFNKIFSNGAPNAVLTYSGLLTGKTSPPIAIIIQSVTVIPDIKVILSVHPLSTNIDIPKGNINEVKLFIDSSSEANL